MESEIHSVIPIPLTTKIRSPLCCDLLTLDLKQLSSHFELRVCPLCTDNWLCVHLCSKLALCTIAQSTGDGMSVMKITLEVQKELFLHVCLVCTKFAH